MAKFRVVVARGAAIVWPSEGEGPPTTAKPTKRFEVRTNRGYLRLPQQARRRAAGNPIGIAVETDTAFAVGAGAPAGIALELDTALALGVSAVLATETDTAIALTPRAVGQVGFALETDTAIALTGVQRLPAGMAVETDSAQALLPGQAGKPMPVHTRNRPGRGPFSTGRMYIRNIPVLAPGNIVIGFIGLAQESDTAVAPNGVQLRGTGLASELDAAFALTGSAPGTVGVASEHDTALQLAAVQVLATGQADEADEALTLASARPVDVAVEVDTAFALYTAVGLAEEHDSAFALDAFVVDAVGLALELDTALQLFPSQGSAPAGMAEEIDEALALDCVMYAARARRSGKRGAGVGRSPNVSRLKRG